ncbi:MAG: polyhydroxyalkanoate synthesis repressor PhaR [Rhodothalassiaceae bacterium]
MTDEAKKGETVVIKKYANRRLYNTETSSYVTLDHLAELVRKGRDFIVRDAKSGEDITRQVLTQIIFEQENKGQQLLPIPFLRRLIGYYGDQLQMMVPSYLQSSLEAFAKNQDRMRKTLEESLNPVQALSMLDEVTRQNMAMFERALGMFSPFRKPAEQATEHPSAPDGDSGSKIDRLEAQLAAMQRQLDEMRKK